LWKRVGLCYTGQRLGREKTQRVKGGYNHNKVGAGRGEKERTITRGRGREMESDSDSGREHANNDEPRQPGETPQLCPFKIARRIAFKLVSIKTIHLNVNRVPVQTKIQLRAKSQTIRHNK